MSKHGKALDGKRPWSDLEQILANDHGTSEVAPRSIEPSSRFDLVNGIDGGRLALKPAHIVSDHPLERDRAIQASSCAL